jgi:hypothetical protein
VTHEGQSRSSDMGVRVFFILFLGVLGWCGAGLGGDPVLKKS